jgi:hypothetical protein
MQGIESYLAKHSTDGRYVHVMTQVSNPDTIKFLSDPLYDVSTPLSETTVFAEGKLYANNMARMMLIGNFFNPQVGPCVCVCVRACVYDLYIHTPSTHTLTQILNVFTAIAHCLDHQAGGCVLHQIPVKCLRNANVGW